jgi:uncharacterized protein (TIGR02271 family)
VTENRDDRSTELGEQYAGYAVYDRQGEKIGNVDDIFIDENDQPEYIGVKMRFQGTKSTLIPVQALRVDRQRNRIEVSVDKATAKDGPAFDNDEEITPEDEERVRRYYHGFEGRQGAAQGGGYADHYRNEDDTAPRSGGAAGVAGEERRSEDRDLDREPNQDRNLDRDREGATTGGAGESRDREGLDTVAGKTNTGEPHDRGRDRDYDRDRDREGVGATARGAGSDEARVQRVEEELRVGTRERETGAVRVTKRVRTDREQVRVPIRREEISVDRVPVVDRDASQVEIGDDEVVVPIVEEEIVVEKRPVVKEELRIRKDVVEDEEVVEEDVRKEEVDVVDETLGRRGGGVEGRADRRDTDLDDRTGGRGTGRTEERGRGIGGRDTDVDDETQRRR